MLENRTSRMIITATGIILIAFGLLINEWTLAQWNCDQHLFMKDDRLRILLFQAVCILMGTGFIAFRKKIITINIILLMVSILISFVIGEAYFRWFNPQIGGRTEQEVFFQYHDVLGWQFIPNKTGTLISKHEYENRITINSAGMRDKEYTLSKPPLKQRIVVMGDSFTAGLGVKDQEVFTEVMEAELAPNVEVLNFGVNGYGPTQELLLLETKAIKYDPDLVVLVFYIRNDFDDTTNISEWIDGYKRPQAVLTTGGGITFTNIPVPKSNQPNRRHSQFCSLPRSHLIDFADKIIRERRDKYALEVLPEEVRVCRINLDPSIENALPLLKGVLKEFVKISKEHNAKFVIVIAPSIVQVHDDLYWGKIKNVYNLNDKDFDLFLPNKLLTSIAHDLNIPVIDLTQSMRSHRKKDEPLYYLKNMHWNAAGHKLAAQEILKYIQTNNILTAKE